MATSKSITRDSIMQRVWQAQGIGEVVRLALITGDDGGNEPCEQALAAQTVILQEVSEMVEMFKPEAEAVEQEGLQPGA